MCARHERSAVGVNVVRRILPIAAALSLVPSPLAAAADQSGSPEVHFVPMDEIVVPIIDSARSTGALRVKMVLDAVDEEAAAKITADLPALRETSVSAAIEFARLYASPMAPIDAERLSAHMTKALDARTTGLSHVLVVEVSAARV